MFQDAGDDLKIAVVCSSNQNRSMEAHHVLSKKGFTVASFGTGNQVKLPGASADKPNTYPFGTPYEHIFQDLTRKDPNLYTQNGMLSMLDRNRRIKKAPERFQDSKMTFDVIITCEERVYDQVLEDMLNRERATATETAHIINMDIQDNPEEATVGALRILELCNMMQGLEDLDDEIEEIILEYEEKIQKTLLHTVAFY